jgi:hypothetical protein
VERHGQTISQKTAAAAETAAVQDMRQRELGDAQHARAAAMARVPPVWPQLDGFQTKELRVDHMKDGIVFAPSDISSVALAKPENDSERTTADETIPKR